MKKLKTVDPLLVVWQKHKPGQLKSAVAQLETMLDMECTVTGNLSRKKIESHLNNLIMKKHKVLAVLHDAMLLQLPEEIIVPTQVTAAVWHK